MVSGCPVNTMCVFSFPRLKEGIRIVLFSKVANTFKEKNAVRNKAFSPYFNSPFLFIIGIYSSPLPSKENPYHRMAPCFSGLHQA